MQDIEAIAERVILIGKGKVLLDGNLDDLRQAATLSESESGDNANNLDRVVADLYQKLNIM
jgi:ABC-2 type transport system ATP-binding protein